MLNSLLLVWVDGIAGESALEINDPKILDVLVALENIASVHVVASTL